MKNFTYVRLFLMLSFCHAILLPTATKDQKNISSQKTSYSKALYALWVLPGLGAYAFFKYFSKEPGKLLTLMPPELITESSTSAATPIPVTNATQEVSQLSTAIPIIIAAQSAAQAPDIPQLITTSPGHIAPPDEPPTAQTATQLAPHIMPPNVPVAPPQIVPHSQKDIIIAGLRAAVAEWNRTPFNDNPQTITLQRRSALTNSDAAKVEAFIGELVETKVVPATAYDVPIVQWVLESPDFRDLCTRWGVKIANPVSTPAPNNAMPLKNKLIRHWKQFADSLRHITQTKQKSSQDLLSKVEGNITIEAEKLMTAHILDEVLKIERGTPTTALHALIQQQLSCEKGADPLTYAIASALTESDEKQHEMVAQAVHLMLQDPRIVRLENDTLLSPPTNLVTQPSATQIFESHHETIEREKIAVLFFTLQGDLSVCGHRLQSTHNKLTINETRTELKKNEHELSVLTKERQCLMDLRQALLRERCGIAIKLEALRLYFCPEKGIFS